MVYEGVPTPGEHVIPDGANLLKIGVLLVLLFGSFFAGHYGALKITKELHVSGWGVVACEWGWLLMCGSFASVAAQGLGILAHDAVHKVLFRRLWLNELMGGMISAFALLPFNANRQFHMMHHRFSHQRDADPEQPMHKHHLLFAITIGSVIALILQYLILVNMLFGRMQRKNIVNALKDIGYLSVIGIIYLFLLPRSGLSIYHTLVPMLITLPLIFGARSISDHYGLPEVMPSKRGDDGQRDVQQEVSGWVILTPAIFEWLWSSVNYHEVHHKFPYLSHRYLKQTFAVTRDKLPYVVADGYLRNLWRHRKRDYYNRELPNSD